jgi:flagellar basal-body rod modification protein FlgD
MAIDSTRGTSGLGAPTASAVQRDVPGLGKDAFMKLLLAQLKNQDPNAPTDYKEMVTQLSQLTSVEQLVTMSNRLANVEVGLASIANSQSADLAGKNVQADVKAVWLGDQGTANVPFTLEGRASKVTLTIRDADGRVVRRQELGDTFPGTRAWTWDGRSDAGDRLPAGRYRIDVAAQSSAGTPVGASTRVSGRVDRVTFANGYPELVIGEARMLLGDVVSIAP